MTEVLEKRKPLSDTARDIAKRFFRHENAVLIAFLVALIAGIAVLTKGLTITRVNIMNVLLQSSIRGVASVGQAFVILTAGIDVSVGGVGLMCSILGASLMTKTAELNVIGHPLPTYAAIPIVLLVGTSWGMLNGSLVSRVGVPPLIVTLGMWQVATGVGFGITEGISVSELPESLAFLGSGSISGVPVPVIVFVAVAVVGYFVLEYTTFGRTVYGVGGNPTSAWLSGINVKRTQFVAYIVSGFLAGLAAVVFTGRVMSASMQTLEGLELDTIAAVCVGGVSLMGGRGNLIGAIIGVMIIGIINNAMSVLGVGPAMQSIAKGVIIYTAVAVDFIRRR